MSEAAEVEPLAQAKPERKLSPGELALASARDKLVRYLPRAVEIITELAETSENDRVRLAAAESIADRAGLGKSATTQVQVNAGEHEALKNDADEIFERIAANQRAIAEGKINVSIEGLIVHEGDTDVSAS